MPPPQGYCGAPPPSQYPPPHPITPIPPIPPVPPQPEALEAPDLFATFKYVVFMNFWYLVLVPGFVLSFIILKENAALKILIPVLYLRAYEQCSPKAI